MAGQATESNENQVVPGEADPWEAAFAAVLGSDAEGASGPSVAGEAGGVEGDEQEHPVPPASDGSPYDAQGYSGDGAANEGEPGGPDTGDGDGGVSVDGMREDFESFSQEEVEAYRESVRDEVTQQAIDVVAQEYIKQGIRHTDGKLGANINQPDICKRDRDGVPHFFNPETGREFTGDNPRRQAQEYCDDYNRELKESFNDSCQKYIDQLMKDREPELAVIEFDSTYNSLDPIRRSMFDSLIEDYEIVRDGEVVGYSCDLNKALQAVNRQVKIIQENYRASHPMQAAHQNQPEQPKGPALDLKASAAAGKEKGKKPEFKSIAEAMEWEQDRLLEKMKERKQ